MLSLINLALFAVLQILYILFFFNFTFKQADKMSRNPSSYLLVYFAWKSCAIMLQVVLDLSDYNQEMFFLLFHLVLAFLIFQDALKTYPYNDKTVSKCYGIGSMLYFALNLVYFVIKVINIVAISAN